MPTAMLGSSQAPYTDWKWKDLGMYFGGPNFLRTPDGTWWAAGRVIDKGKAQTVLAHLDVDAGKLTPVLTFPSGGKYPFKFTTAVRITPDTLPFPLPKPSGKLPE